MLQIARKVVPFLYPVLVVGCVGLMLAAWVVFAIAISLMASVVGRWLGLM